MPDASTSTSNNAAANAPAGEIAALVTEMREIKALLGELVSQNASQARVSASRISEEEYEYSHGHMTFFRPPPTPSPISNQVLTDPLSAYTKIEAKMILDGQNPSNDDISRFLEDFMAVWDGDHGNEQVEEPFLVLMDEPSKVQPSSMQMSTVTVPWDGLGGPWRDSNHGRTSHRSVDELRRIMRSRWPKGTAQKETVPGLKHIFVR